MPITAKCFTCVDVFGHFVREVQYLESLSHMPTFIVQSEIDDSADPIVGQRVAEEIQARAGMYNAHLLLKAKSTTPLAMPVRLCLIRNLLETPK